MFSISLKDASFQIPIHRSLDCILILSRGMCLSVMGIVLWFFHGSASVHQRLCSGFRLGVSEGDVSPPLPG